MMNENSLSRNRIVFLKMIVIIDNNSIEITNALVSMIA